MVFVGYSRLPGMMGSSETSDITKGTRALSCTFAAFLVTGDSQFSLGNAMGLTCSQIVETGIYT